MSRQLLFFVCGLTSSVALAEDPPKSNTITQREYSYSLTVREGALVLLTQSAMKDAVVERSLSFDIPNAGTVTEMRLEPWVSTGLCAVVEVSVGDEFQYWCVTLAAPTRTAGYDSAAARFHTRAEDLSILAVNGTFRGDSVLALLGTIEVKDGVSRVVGDGVIFLHDCPAPPSPGSISRFRAETAKGPAPNLLKRDE